MSQSISMDTLSQAFSALPSGDLSNLFSTLSSKGSNLDKGDIKDLLDESPALKKQLKASQPNSSDSTLAEQLWEFLKKLFSSDDDDSSSGAPVGSSGGGGGGGGGGGYAPASYANYSNSGSSGPVNAKNVGNIASGNPAGVAQKLLGKSAAELMQSQVIPMQKGIPTNVCCANFVSACLQKTGQLSASEHNNSVDGLKSTLLAKGWHVVDAAHAKPGDVCVLNNGDHVEMVASNKGGDVTLIGSNNRGGPQYVSYGNPYGNPIYLSPP